MWRYAEHERPRIILFFVLHSFSVLGELGKPYAFAMMINTLQIGGDAVVSTVLKWLLIYAGCFFVFEVFHRSARFIERYTAFRNKRRFVVQTYRHLQSLSLRWHSDHHSGAVIDRINKAGDALFHFSESQFVYIGVFIKFWGPLVMLWIISPAISITAVITGVLIVIITRYLYNLSVPEYQAQNEKFHKLAATIHDYIGNIRTIIMLRLGGRAEIDIEKKINKVFPHIVKENKLTQIKCFSTQFLMLLLETGLIFFYVFSNSNTGTAIMIGSVTAIFQYTRQLMDSFMFYTFDFEQIIHWSTDFDAAIPILNVGRDNHRGLKRHMDRISSHFVQHWNNIRLTDLDFSYQQETPLLKGIDFSINKGQKIAFVGESGSGKSTILQIMRGLLPVSRGALVIDQKPTDHFEELGKLTTLIPQEPELFENTIRYNISMGLEEDDQILMESVRLAQFDSVLESLPEGLDSDIREKGVNLSGGERQRLALARGIYAATDSSIVLMDEPTSSIDLGTELSVFDNVLHHFREKTVVSVLHRLHLLHLFDYVYVMKSGRIVEEGTFRDLKQGNGEFSRLWESYQAEASRN